MKSEICLICGRKAEAEHHLIFGRSYRKLSEEDNLKIPVCNWCHNMATKPQGRIHENLAAERLSKMLGQALWERNYVYFTQLSLDEARHAFIERYGRNWL